MCNYAIEIEKQRNVQQKWLRVEITMKKKFQNIVV